MFFTEGSLFLAPMEGVTDDIYRNTVEKCFGAWDYYACDFLRIPSNAPFSSKHILKHYGLRSYQNPYMKEKTYYQVLASETSTIEETVSIIQELGFEWLDLNLGCPSKTVCKNKGGSYLLTDIKLLETILKRIRSTFNKTFTAKIRVGFEDDRNFKNILSCLEHCGVEAVTIHGRTREELYKGIANWDYIKEAVETLSIPVIGNGDIWNPQDIERIFDHTKCHGVMAARGALKMPWMARDYKKKIKTPIAPNIELFFKSLYADLTHHQTPEQVILKIFKGMSRYIFDDLSSGAELKSLLLRSATLKDFLNGWEHYYQNQPYKI